MYKRQVNAYEGTVLYVSHDRYFINRTASRILELSGGQLTGFLGNYDYYLEKKTGDLPNGDLAVKNTVSKAPAPPSEGMQDWKAQKEQQAKQRKKENDIRKCEEEIAKLEEKDKQLDNEMALPENATNVAKLQELTKEKESISARLEELYEKWETLEAL